MSLVVAQNALFSLLIESVNVGTMFEMIDPVDRCRFFSFLPRKLMATTAHSLPLFISMHVLLVLTLNHPPMNRSNNNARDNYSSGICTEHPSCAEQINELRLISRRMIELATCFPDLSLSNQHFRLKIHI
jgi:hypothetical protein